MADFAWLVDVAARAWHPDWSQRRIDSILDLATARQSKFLIEADPVAMKLVRWLGTECSDGM